MINDIYIRNNEITKESKKFKNFKFCVQEYAKNA